MLARLQQLIVVTLARRDAAAVARAAQSRLAAGLALAVRRLSIVAGYARRSGDRVRLAAALLRRRRSACGPRSAQLAARLGDRGHRRAAGLPLAPALPMAQRGRPSAGRRQRPTRRRSSSTASSATAASGIRWLRRLRQRGIPFVAVNLEPLFGSIDDYGRRSTPRSRGSSRRPALAPVIVATAWAAWPCAPGSPRSRRAPVHRIVTIASPHAGTRLGAHGRGANVRQMRLGSAWLAQLLAARIGRRRARRFTCFWSHCDNIVFPTRSATLAGADNRHLAATPHVHMVDHPAVFDEVLAIVAESAGAEPESIAASPRADATRRRSPSPASARPRATG